MDNNNSILCFHCATIIDNSCSECPNCGKFVDKKSYERILNKLNQYILFGYTYRTKYEQQYAKSGKIETKYQFGFLSDVFAWVGLAVLGGVIGGASWDFVKQLVWKIAVQTKDENIKKLASNEESLKLFSDYMLDYHRSFKGVTEEVQDAIYEEMRAHIAEEIKPPENIDFDDKTQILKFLKRCAKKAGEKHRKSKISVSIVKGLWGKTKVSIEIDK